MAEFPSSQRRGGCGINKKSRSHRNSRRRGGQFGEMFRPEDFAELLLRLRPIGLALRATPAAPNRKGNIFFMARPPLLCEEGNLLSDARIRPILKFLPCLISDSSSTLMPSPGGDFGQRTNRRFINTIAQEW